MSDNVTENNTLSEGQLLLKNIREMLNEEKWTRAALSNYSTSQFKEFDIILKNAKNLHIIDDIKKDCDEHLVHSKNSIIALYISGMIALSRQIIDDAAMVNLIRIFSDNHKWAIVKYLCERILEYGESKFALHTLISFYKNENNEEAMYGILERLVKVDYEEADSAKTLADYHEKKGSEDAAVDYYKKALHRYVGKGLFAHIKGIWEKLLVKCPDETDYFINVQKKVAKNIGEEKAIDLLKVLYNSCKGKSLDIDNAINILKMILQYDEKDYPIRKEIVECYRKKFKDHSQLEDYIRVSNLTQSYRNVHQAISDFEKHIAFDRGNFVFHRTWGVGKIAGIEGDEIRIDFAKKRGHLMSLKMAVEALQTLPKEHIWVIKATWKKEKLLEQIKKDIPWALKTIIKSFGNSCDMKRIKAELSPGLLSEKEWTNWNAKAREILKSDTNIGVSQDNIDVFTIRDRPITVTEKLYNEFKAEKNFYDRAGIIRNFISQKNAEIDSEYFAEMYAYLLSFLKTSNQANELSIASYLLIKELAVKHPHLGANLPINFADTIKSLEDIPGVFISLKDARFRESFLSQIQIFIPAWADIFIDLFPRSIVPAIVIQLEKEGYAEELTRMAIECFENFKDQREATAWLIKNSSQAQWFKAANISFEKQIITLIHIMDLCFRDIENQRKTSEARKILKLAYSMLFKENYLVSFINDSDLDTVTRIYNFINDVKNLDPKDKIDIRSKILDRHPDFKFADITEIRVSQGLMTTKDKFNEKQKQLAYIMDVEIPANSKEIEEARLHGDLKENAEYISAKEKQVILNTTAEKLKEDIERTQIFDPLAVDISKVSFGTIIVLNNQTMGRKEEYTLLGPWESDPENNVISYLTPFGKTMLGKTIGDQFNFKSDDEKNSYLVESIRAVTF